jgi:hypothetical protein
MAAVLLVVVGADQNKDTKKSGLGIVHVPATPTLRRHCTATSSPLARAHCFIPILVGDLAHGFPPVRPIRKKLLVSIETDYTEARLKTEPSAAARKVAI